MLRYMLRDMLSLDFLEVDLEIASTWHFDFSRKIFLKLHSINWPGFITWLPLLFEILVNMCIAIVYEPGCDVIYFESNLIFLTKPFSYMNKKLRKELLTWNKKHFLSFL